MTPSAGVVAARFVLDALEAAFLNAAFVGLDRERRFVEDDAFERRPGRSGAEDVEVGTCRILSSEVARSGAQVREARERVVDVGQEDRMEGTSG